jgi:hypothetical protein
MGKREETKREKHPRDYYATVDPVASKVLADFLGRHRQSVTFIEPCAGDGRLFRDLVKYNNAVFYCIYAYDIEPQANQITQRNCLTLTSNDCEDVDYFITNPPFTWNSLQPILECLPTLLPTWLLLPADTIHNKRMGPYMKKCSTILSVGRMYWFEDRPIKGVDNFCWMLFGNQECKTIFIGR